MGADGEVTRVRNRNRAGSCKVTLQQGSSGNAMLSALALLDETSGLGVVPANFHDMSGLLPVNTTASSTYAWVRKLPDWKGSGDSESNLEWVLDFASMAYFIGGN